MRRTVSRPPFLFALVLACAGLLAACGPGPDEGPEPKAPKPLAATKPAQAVRQLTAHLRANDFEAFTREAVPPALHVRLQAAWREGRTRWPLDELPFGRKLPAMLGALAKPGSEARLQSIFDRQFAGAERELHNTAASLGLFGAQYIAHDPTYSEDEKQHYTQLVAAASAWGTRAPLADRQRAKQSIGQLAGAARRTGLASEADFAKAGMAASLRKMGGFSAAVKRVLARYGLDVDAGLGTLDATLQQQTGDQARVRMRYRFAGQDIDTVVSLRRIDGRWYLEDYLRHAEDALGPPAEGVAAGDADGPAPAPAGAARR
jgi:hypothetical protein